MNEMSEVRLPASTGYSRSSGGKATRMGSAFARLVAELVDLLPRDYRYEREFLENVVPHLAADPSLRSAPNSVRDVIAKMVDAVGVEGTADLPQYVRQLRAQRTQWEETWRAEDERATEERHHLEKLERARVRARKEEERQRAVRRAAFVERLTVRMGDGLPAADVLYASEGIGLLPLSEYEALKAEFGHTLPA